MRIRRSVLTVALVLGLLGAILTSGVASARHTGPGGISTSVKTLVAVLYGDAEVPGPGDPYGFGVAVISLDELNGRVCFDIWVDGIEPAAAAHIHRGGSNVAGPIVVHLSPPTNGSVRGCTDVGRPTVQAISWNPAGFYVNVHNPSYPAGAVRGQLFQS